MYYVWCWLNSVNTTSLIRMSTVQFKLLFRKTEEETIRIYHIMPTVSYLLVTLTPLYPIFKLFYLHFILSSSYSISFLFEIATSMKKKSKEPFSRLEADGAGHILLKGGWCGQYAGHHFPDDFLIPSFVLFLFYKTGKFYSEGECIHISLSWPSKQLQSIWVRHTLSSQPSNKVSVGTML